MKYLSVLIMVIALGSCASTKNKSRITHSSVFVNISELGTSKEAFILKYGLPVNKDLVANGTKKIETLYYVEIIDRIIITTKFRFENDQLQEQSNYRMEYSEDKRLKELKDDLQRARLQSFMNQMKN